MLKRRSTDIKDSKWSAVCIDEFGISGTPLPTPARVYNEFVDAMAGDEIAAVTREVRIDLLHRQHAIGSAMTALVYPYFDSHSSESTKMQASNEVFYAAGFSATTSYCDPIIRTMSVCRLFSTLLRILKNMRTAKAGDYPLFIEMCEMSFIER